MSTDISDVVIVGSGINSLVCAAMLSAAGRSVTVLERNRLAGGCMRTEELFPGYLHDVMASWYPLFVHGPAYASLKSDLDRAGLRFVHGDYATGLATTDGRGLALRCGIDDAIRRIDAIAPGDGTAFAAMANQLFGPDAALTFGLLGDDLWRWSTLGLVGREWHRRGTAGLLGFCADSIETFRRWAERSLRSELARALMAPWALHAGLGPDDACSGSIGRLAFANTLVHGIQAADGGAGEVVRAFESVLARRGGRLLTGIDVERIVTRGDRATGVVAAGCSYDARLAVVCSVTPQQLYGRLLEDVPQALHDRAMAYRFGRADMQVHFALSSEPSWRVPELAHVPLLHVADGLDGVCMSVAEANNGLLPRHPTLAVGQPVVLDPKRAPPGGWILWVQALEMPAHPRGDAAGEIDVGNDGQWTDALREAMADRIQMRLESVMPGLRGLVVGRQAFSPPDLEAMNCNLVGGDPYAGACSPDQFFWMRPFAGVGRVRGHHTPYRNLFHIGAATHPGPGLAGTSGYLVARRIAR